MAEINFSKQLSEKLGDDKVNEIAELSKFINFKEMLVDVMETNNCSDVVRETVLQKMEGITEVLVKISSINAMHISNDKKREKIEKELDGFNLKNFKKELYAEISATDRTLKSKIKDMGKKLKDATTEKAASIKQKFESDMKFIQESIDETMKRQKELKHKDTNSNEIEGEVVESEMAQEESLPTQTPEEKKQELLNKRDELKAEKQELESAYEKSTDERQLLVSSYKSLGFWGTFKKLWGERKDNPDKKEGFFTIVKNAYKESTFSKAEADKKGAKKEMDDLYLEQVRIEDKLKKLDQDYKALAQQLKEINKQIAFGGKGCLEECRNAYDKAVEPVAEVTPEKMQSITERIANFGKGLGDKASKWKENMDKVVSTVFAYTIDPIVDTVLEANKEREIKKAEDKAKSGARNSGDLDR